MNSLESRDPTWAELIVELRRYGVMLLEEHGIDLALEVRGEPAEPGPGLFAGLSLFRIYREALTNVTRHAGASAVAVRLAFAPDRLDLEIADDGRGLPAAVVPGRGLGNMRHRAAELGGRLDLANGPGLGLTFAFPIPMVSPDEGMDAAPATG
ncbi:MAG: hypothetical protein HY906_24785 [Deltaproteobacteria bacterium]|nr:hypothetical protein [Deltaproteobacteria bacterium]